MGLYKRGNIWWFSFTINSQRFYSTTNEKLKVKAIIEANNIYNKYKDIIINKKLDFPTIVNQYLELNHIKTLSQSAKNNYKTVIKVTIDYFEIHKKDIFNKNDLYLYVEYLASIKNLSNATIKGKYFPCLSTIFNEAKKIGLINENPIKDLDLSNYSKINKRERYLTQEERKQIQEYCLNHNKQELLDYIEFAIETGLRLGEQLNLAWDRVYFDKKEIYIIETKTDKNRTIPLTPLANNILKNRNNLPQPFNLSKGILGYKYAQLKDDLNLENLTWHDLRHTFASWAIKGIHDWQNGNEMPVPKLQKWLGHSDIKMTMRYSHLHIEDLKSEVKEC
ncbi:tyrosine-type recombinase/integrase [Rickettsiales bacterium LUAb2]